MPVSRDPLESSIFLFLSSLIATHGWLVYSGSRRRMDCALLLSWEISLNLLECTYFLPSANHNVLTNTANMAKIYASVLDLQMKKYKMHIPFLECRHLSIPFLTIDWWLSDWVSCLSRHVRNLGTNSLECGWPVANVMGCPVSSPFQAPQSCSPSSK